MKHLTNWVEIPVTDLKRAIRFYSKVLNVKLEEMTISDVSYAIFPSKDAYNTGALAMGAYYKPSSEGVTIYLDGGDDINIVLDKIRDAGGNVVLNKTFLSKEAGFIALFIDSEGNKIGLQNMEQ